MNDSRARELLELAAAEADRLPRHLLVAAALRDALPDEPVVVGGTAEEFWTADEYHETDLDLCALVGKDEKEILIHLGFQQQGRHWVHEASGVAVEFPGALIDGDYERTVEVAVGPGSARVIGLDDLYLDRLRQATVSEQEGMAFKSALAVAAARYDDIDWAYVETRIKFTVNEDPSVGHPMRQIDSRIRRRVRRELTRPDSDR